MVQTSQRGIKFKGGLDLTSPPLSAVAGSLRDSLNYEVNIFGGYRRIDGYEKFDGQTLCSSYGYWYIQIAATAAIDIGRTIVGFPSGATGFVIGTNASGLVFYVRPTGTFVNGEEIRILGAPVGFAVSDATNRADYLERESSALMALAATEYRNSIQGVPGSGNILGLGHFGGDLYAFRNNVGATAMAVYKSSSSGWVLQPFDRQISFTAGSGVMLDGATLTRGGVSATILRVVIESGSLGSSTAAGRLIIGVPSGSFTAGAATTTGPGALTLSGAESLITHAPSGRVVTKNYDFGSGVRMYFSSGIDFAFEFDGTVFVPLRTGMVNDKPDLLEFFKNHLFLAFGNSLQHSALSNPYSFSVVLGAAELNMGADITNMLPQSSDASGGAMAISTRSSMFVLYGNSAADWKLVPYQRDSGAFQYTMQAIAANSYFLDDRGITNLSAAQEFGNFNSATVSEKVYSWLVQRKLSVIDSCVYREKNQLRIFFLGGSALHITFDGAQVAGMMPVQYGHNICASIQTELSDGTEAVYYGDDSGNVYLSDSGPSFAGDVVGAFYSLHFDNCDSPRILKRFRKAIFEVGSSGYAEFTMTASYGYGASDLVVRAPVPVVVPFASGRWDDPGLSWDGGVWDGRTLLPVGVGLDGTEENISITVSQSSNSQLSMNFHAALLQFSTRRLKR